MLYKESIKLLGSLRITVKLADPFFRITSETLFSNKIELFKSVVKFGISICTVFAFSSKVVLNWNKFVRAGVFFYNSCNIKFCTMTSTNKPHFS